jgi:WD40 repeat protein
VWSAVPSADGREVLTVGGNAARLWDISSGRLLQGFRPHGALRSVAFAPSGKRAVTAGMDGDVKIWCVEEQSPDFGHVIGKIAQAHEQQGAARAVNSAVFGTAPDGDEWLLTAGDDGTARLWSLSEKPIRLVRTLVGHSAGVTRAVFSPPGTPWLAATASLDGTVRLWTGEGEKPGETANGRVLGGGSTRSLGVLCAAFSPDGRRLAAGGFDSRVRIWNLDQDAAPLVLEGHTAAIAAVGFSPDGRRVVSGSRDGMAKIWDAQLGNPLLSLDRHTADVTDVCFSSDGDRVLTASGDQKAIIWLAEPLPSASPAPASPPDSTTAAADPGSL